MSIGGDVAKAQMAVHVSETKSVTKCMLRDCVHLFRHTSSLGHIACFLLQCGYTGYAARWCLSVVTGAAVALNATTGWSNMAYGISLRWLLKIVHLRGPASRAMHCSRAHESHMLGSSGTMLLQVFRTKYKGWGLRAAEPILEVWAMG